MTVRSYAHYNIMIDFMYFYCDGKQLVSDALQASKQELDQITPKYFSIEIELLLINHVIKYFQNPYFLLNI